MHAEGAGHVAVPLRQGFRLGAGAIHDAERSGLRFDQRQQGAARRSTGAEQENAAALERHAQVVFDIAHRPMPSVLSPYQPAVSRHMVLTAPASRAVGTSASAWPRPDAQHVRGAAPRAGQCREETPGVRWTRAWALTALASSSVGLFTYVADDATLRTLTFWNLGSLNGASYRNMAVAAGAPAARPGHQPW